MTNNFKDMLNLFSCAVNGANIRTDLPYDFNAIFALSKKQQIDTILFPVINSIYSQNQSLIEKSTYDRWESDFYKTISFSMIRTNYINKLLSNFEEQNIDYCVLKGEVLADLYFVPDSRVSGDVDIWIRDCNKVKNALNILAADGFRVPATNSNSHQIECYHKIYGLVEIHTDICDKIAKTLWFENKLRFDEKPIRFEDKKGNKFYTLSYTDGAVFVAFHFLKHFLSHGCGCRQLMDMLLYFTRYKQQINWEKFDLVFKELNYLRFIKMCEKIGEKYFGLNFETDIDVSDEIIESILTDLETAGVFGKEEEYRDDFTISYSKRRSGINKNGKRLKNDFIIFKAINFLRTRKFNPIIVVMDLNKRRKFLSENKSQIRERLKFFENLGFFDN